MPAAGVNVGIPDPSEPPATSPSNTQAATNATPNLTSPENEKQKENETPLKNAVKDGKDDKKEEEKINDIQVDDFGLPIRTRSTPERPPDGPSESTDDRPEDKDVQTAEAAVSKNDTAPDESAPKEQSEPVKKSEETAAGTAAGTTDNATENTKVAEQQSLATAATATAAPAVVETPTNVTAAEKSPTETSKSPPPNHPAPKPKNAEISEWSHMRIAQPVDAHESEEEEEEPEDWKAMPALGELDYYDDYGRLIARGGEEEDDEAVYQGLGGAGRGYTRVQLDEDAQSATSLDEDTSYLFRETGGNSAGFEGEELRDTMSQLQATKDLLNETQKIAYVGVVRLAIHILNSELAQLPATRGTRKALQKACDNMRKWGQAMMGRLYAHMDISSAEQIMIEQLAEHGVQPEDLIRPLMQNARVKNPMAESDTVPSTPSVSSPSLKSDARFRMSSETAESSEPGSPPPYEAHEGEGVVPEVQTPSQMPTSDRIDIDLRWTVLCDLFLVLIADSAYDARSRTLLERVGAAMDITWLQISRFEKRVTDALEMQEQAEKESWDETDHMDKRAKMSKKRKYMLMGLATVGGGLVIGLSAGLLAPVIGAGLAAGLTTVGISGTSAFLGGAGGTALIASGATLGGSAIGLRASHRRTGAVQTFEYRPLHNNKKLNLIVTVSGWMTGKVDDVRLPYSTVDPIMGDIYSVLWEPEMLRSMGDTINILATEVSLLPNG